MILECVYVVEESISEALLVVNWRRSDIVRSPDEDG